MNRSSSARRFALLSRVFTAVLASTACGGAPSAASPSEPHAHPSAPPTEADGQGGGDGQSGGQVEGARDDAGARASFTVAQCQDAGGEVVGDIGNGAIYRPEYRCPRSGEPPLGRIATEAGQPMGVEGAVCCR
jgi:hypothetical protein